MIKNEKSIANNFPTSTQYESDPNISKDADKGSISKIAPKIKKEGRNSTAGNATRLTRAYNTIIPVSGKVLTGGMDDALQRPKRFFSLAHNIEDSNSLTTQFSSVLNNSPQSDNEHSSNNNNQADNDENKNKSFHKR